MTASRTKTPVDHWPAAEVEEFIDSAVELAKAGFPEHRIASILGMSRPNWLRIRKTLDADPLAFGLKWSQFARRYKEAAVDREAKYLQAVDAACDPQDPKLFDWKAAQFRLAVTDPDTYAQRTLNKIEVTQQSDAELADALVDTVLGLPRESEAFQRLLSTLRDEIHIFTPAPVRDERQLLLLDENSDE